MCPASKLPPDAFPALLPVSCGISCCERCFHNVALVLVVHTCENIETVWGQSVVISDLRDEMFHHIPIVLIAWICDVWRILKGEQNAWNWRYSSAM